MTHATLPPDPTSTPMGRDGRRPPSGLPASVGGGRYVLGEPIGAGGTAWVFRAQDGLLGVQRAVKVLSTETLGRESLRARLRSEARAMARIEHPNILRVFDVGAEGPFDWVVMELADGGSLQERLDLAGPLPPHEAVRVTLQVLSALCAAHEAGVVHRDVKPHNILLGRDGVARLADFGIALLNAEDEVRQTRAGVSMGTLAYMPPEQRIDARSVGPGADIYAVGTTFYALLTNENPVDLFAALEGSPRWEAVPPQLRSTVLRATRLLPADRFSSAQEMALDLIRLLREAGGELAALASETDSTLRAQGAAFEAAAAFGARGSPSVSRERTGDGPSSASNPRPPAPPRPRVGGPEGIVATLVPKAEPPPAALRSSPPRASAHRRVAGVSLPPAETLPPVFVSALPTDEGEPALTSSLTSSADTFPAPPPRRRVAGSLALGVTLLVGLATGLTLALRSPDEPGGGADGSAPLAAPSARSSPPAAAAAPAPAPAPEPPPTSVPEASTPEARAADRPPRGTTKAPASRAAESAATADPAAAPIGKWTGSFGGRQADLQLRGTASTLRGTMTVRFQQNAVRTSVEGSWDAATRTLRLTDVEQTEDAGTYTATRSADSGQLSGRFDGARNGRRVSFSLRRAP